MVFVGLSLEVFLTGGHFAPVHVQNIPSMTIQIGKTTTVHPSLVFLRFSEYGSPRFLRLCRHTIDLFSALRTKGEQDFRSRISVRDFVLREALKHGFCKKHQNYFLASDCEAG